MIVLMRWVFALLLLGHIALFAAMQWPHDKTDSDAMASTPLPCRKHPPDRGNEVPATAQPSPSPSGSAGMPGMGLSPTRNWLKPERPGSLKLGESDISVRSNRPRPAATGSIFRRRNQNRMPTGKWKN